MDCKKARTLIPYAADNTLSEVDLSRLQSHIAGCRMCAALLDQQLSSIADISTALESAALQVNLPDDFASRVAAIVSEQCGIGSSPFVCAADWFSTIWSGLASSRKAVSAAVCATALAVTMFVSVEAFRILNTSPVATTQVTSGHFIAFTVKPQSGGNVVAGVNTHRYCKITRDSEEALP